MRPHASSQPVIEFAEAAAYDFVDLDAGTRKYWSENQADLYIAYLRGVFADLASRKIRGLDVEGWPGYLVYLAQYSHRRRSHGHRIFYVESQQGIVIVRILHTAMNWQDHLP